jgi:outer membrane protein assembly factor BamB
MRAWQIGAAAAACLALACGGGEPTASGVGDITGRVTDANTGSGLFSAVVFVASQSTTTDGDGRYTLSQVPTGTHAVTANKTGYVSLTVSVSVVRGGSATANLALTSTFGRISGRVTDAVTGSGVVFAVVRAGSQSATTDTQGNYALSGVAPGTQTVAVSKTGYVDASKTVVVTAGQTSTADVSLAARPGSITGHIADTTGAKLQGVTLSTPSAAATSDASGAYALGDLPAGIYTVTAAKTGYVTATASVTVPPGGTATADFSLRRRPVLTQLWSFPLPGTPGDPVLGRDGTIYLPVGFLNRDAAGFLYAINPDGTQKWRLSLPIIPGLTAPAIASDGTIYVHGNGLEGNLVAVEKIVAVSPTGTLLWTTILNGGFGIFTSNTQSTPAVGTDGTVYIGSLNTFVYAINPNGSIKWAAPSPSFSSISSSPRIAPDGTIYALDAASVLLASTSAGTLRWSVPIVENIAGGNDQSPTIAPDGTIYVGSLSGQLVAITPAGAIKWRLPLVTANSLRGNPVLAADGTIYMSGGGLNAVSPAGALLWHFPKPGEPDVSSATYELQATPALLPGGALVWSDGSNYYVIGADGTQLQRIKLDSFLPIDLAATPVVSSTGVAYLPLGAFGSFSKNELRAYRTP